MYNHNIEKKGWSGRENWTRDKPTLSEGVGMTVTAGVGHGLVTITQTRSDTGWRRINMLAI